MNDMLNNETNQADASNVTMTSDEMLFVKQQVEQNKREAARKKTLESYKNHPELGEVFNELLEKGGLSEELAKDPTILDSETALKMAMKMSQMSYKQKLESDKGNNDVAQDHNNSGNINVPSSNAASGGNTSSDPYEKPFKSMKDMNVDNFKNLSNVGKLNAQLLKS